MPGQISRPDDVMADATCHPRQASGLQVKSLSGLYCKLGAAAVPQGQTVGAQVVAVGSRPLAVQSCWHLQASVLLPVGPA